jgi:hypothetical protein
MAFIEGGSYTVREGTGLFTIASRSILLDPIPDDLY